MSRLKLEKYRTTVRQELSLDLRENRQAKSEESAFLDLNRSAFFHRLRVLGVGFVSALRSSQQSSNWAERWAFLEQYAGGRIYWILGHVLWAGILRTGPEGAMALNAIMSIIAALALTGAARQMFGPLGMWWCVLLCSLSPLFLNYSVRVLATMPAVMWICVALFAFTRPRATVISWIAGGAALGMAFALGRL